MCPCPLFRMLSYLLLALLMFGCKGRSGAEETSVKDTREEWHMTDEPSPVQPSPMQEESFRQAALDGDLDKVKLLLNQGVPCHVRDQDGHTALMFAAYNGHSEIILALIEAGAEVDQKDLMDRTALLYGATGPFPETVKILLEHGADPNQVDSEEHFSPLMHAAAEGNLEVVKVLLNHGADKALKDVDGDDASFFAAQAGHRHVVEYLKGNNN